MAKEELKKATSKKAKATPSPLVAAASLSAERHDDNDGTNQMQQEADAGKKPNPQRQLKKSKKRARQEADEAAEERRLTELLFGASERMDQNENAESQVVESKTSSIYFEIDRGEDHVPEQEVSVSNLFEIDRDGANSTSEEEHGIATAGTRGLVNRDTDLPVSQHDEDDEYDESSIEPKQSTPSAAWVDDDDVGLSINLLATSRLRKLRKSRDEAEAEALEGAEFEKRLRKRFQETTQTTARTDWAAVPVADGNDGKTAKAEQDEESSTLFMDSTSMRLLDSSRQLLPPHILNMVRCRDANQDDPNQAVVQAVHFHPGSDPERPLLLTAGLDKTLRFFQVGSEESVKIHGIHFPKLPIYSAAFLGTSGNVLVSGRRPYFYVYNAVAGKLDHVPRIVGREEKSLEKFAVSPDGRIIAFYGNDGYIILVDASSKHWMMDLKMNGSVRAICFSPDCTYLLASGSDGDVYRWDVRTWKCVERFANEDGTISCSMAASSSHLAVGAESGVVNLYSEKTSISSWSTTRTPLKSILNLSTSADLICFNGDGQILAMSTRRETHGLKLLHVPTGTVFSNWPTSKTPLSYVWSMDFSPQSRFFAVGNDKGKCLLYRLPHYEID